MVRWSADVAVGDWLVACLSGWGVVGSTVPRGYECYARVFHPVCADKVVGTPATREHRVLRWADVAAARGTRMHPAAQWGAIAGKEYGTVELPDGWSADVPGIGRLALEQLAQLAPLLAARTTTPADVTVGIWAGWADLRPGSGAVLFSATGMDAAAARDAEQAFLAEVSASVDPEIAAAVMQGPRLVLPGREYVLLAADVHEFADPGWATTAGIGWHGAFTGPTPNLLWPADRAWFLATEIDFDSTLIGGSRELLDDILANRQLEAAEVTEDTDLGWTGDTINPVPGS